MAFTVRVTKSVTEGSTTIQSSVDHACDLVAKMDESVADGVSNAEYAVSVAVANMKAAVIQSSVAMTIKTNSSGSPQETIVLAPNVPVVWQEGDAAIFAGDVTSIFVSNASGAVGTLKIIIGSAVA